MKVNLLLDNPHDVRSGYLNLDPFAPEPDSHGRIRCEIVNLNKLVDAGEAEEIVAHDIIGYFPPKQIDEILDNWLSKLAHKGTLTLSAVDFREVSHKTLGNIITIDQINSLVYGDQRQPWEFRKSAFTLPLLITMFESRGFRIMSKRIQDHKAVVTVYRS